MKQNLRYLLFAIVKLISYLYIKCFKLINYGRTPVFVYTDSRGFEISKLYRRKTPFSSYLSYLIKKFKTDIFICPEKHTTIFDFLYQLKNSGGSSKYKHVLAHIGVVDFSPRPFNEVLPILQLKKHKIIAVFGEDFYNELCQVQVYEQEYLGQKTASILPENKLGKIADEFNKIDNLIWITTNPIDVSWRGNYMRDRPLNINLVNDKSKQLLTMLNNHVKVIDITDMTIENVHIYTCDNIHLSLTGMELIKNEIKKWISQN